MAPPNEERPEWSIECAGYMKESNLVNCPGPTVEHADQAVAVALWNRRAQRPFTKEEREALEYAERLLVAESYRPSLAGSGPRYTARAITVRRMLDSSKGGTEKMSAPSEKP